MTPEEIRAIAKELHTKLPMATQEDAIEFALRFLTAITEKAEPVAWMFQHNETGMTMCIDAWQVDNGFEKMNPRMKKTRPLFLHPAPEPTGEVVVTTTEEGKCVAVTRQDEEGRILKVIWEADPAPEPVKSAPLPDDVAKMVEWLRKSWKPLVSTHL